jgi:hypothetical protein
VRATEPTLETITLAAGPAVPLAALQLGWDLEARGLTLAIEGPHLVVSPSSRITDSDRAQIRRWRDELFAVVAYLERREAKQ